MAMKMLIFGLIVVLCVFVALVYAKNETDVREGTTTHLSTAKGTIQGGRSLQKVSSKFYTPISIGDGSDPKVQLCKLDWTTYSEAPHKYPMFKDLIILSKCATQIWDTILGSKFGIQIWDPNLCSLMGVPKLGFQIWTPNLGSKLGSQI